MISKSIDQSKDKDIAHSSSAMKRAALRAAEVARRTRTMLVIWRDGKAVRVSPDEFERGLTDRQASDSAA